MRAATEQEYLVALCAAQIAPRFNTNDVVESAVKMAEDIVRKVIERGDELVGHRECIDTEPLAMNVLDVDQAWSQRQDGSDRRVSMCIQWAEGTLTGAETDELGEAVNRAAREFASTVRIRRGVELDIDQFTAELF